MTKITQEKPKEIGYWRYSNLNQLFSFSQELCDFFKLQMNENYHLNDILTYIHPDDIHAFTNLFNDAITHEKPFSVIVRVLSNEITYWIQVTSRLDYKDSLFMGYLGTISNYTWKVSSEFSTTDDYQKLLKKIKLLEKDHAELKTLTLTKNENKSRFISTMSHELRTPMNALVGFTHLLEQTSLNIEQKEYVDRILDASKHLLSIINDILDLSKIEAGKMTIENYPFSIESLIKEIEMLFIDQIKAKHLYFDIDVSNVPSYVIGDMVRIRQILINLVSNAIKFTDEGGISFLVKSKPVGKHVALSFSVKDTGIGMTQKQLNKIFADYEQASQATSRLYGGTGLGLSISKQLADLMNGKLSCHSLINEGTTFELTLLLEIDHNSDAKNEKDLMVTSPRKGAHILVAEDHLLSAKLTKRLLEQLDMHVVLVHNGKDAVSKVEDELFDLILMDMNMPVMDGIQATKMIRKHHQKIPIIALTANLYNEEKSECLLAGMNDILIKPLDPKLLNQMIAKWLPLE